ncbi:MAG: hypothetical protein ABS58_03740 [Mesorhizobium sp. SCN 65-20]|nr:MAG: hypothetical protein ABS58_03740 [Mesorhizobium sp. SCN 65-20]
MTALEPFVPPLMVELGRPGNFRRVTHAGEAAECLMTAWPLERGPRHREAVGTCLKVLDGRRSAEDARRAFLEACREANVPVSELPEP